MVRYTPPGVISQRLRANWAVAPAHLSRRECDEPGNGFATTAKAGSTSSHHLRRIDLTLIGIGYARGNVSRCESWFRFRRSPDLGRHSTFQRGEDCRAESRVARALLRSISWAGKLAFHSSRQWQHRSNT